MEHAMYPSSNSTTESHYALDRKEHVSTDVSESTDMTTVTTTTTTSTSPPSYKLISYTSPNSAFRQVCTFVHSRSTPKIHDSLRQIHTVDLFLHGRGFRSFWQVGAVYVIQQTPYQIRHIHCYSFGAIIGVSIVLQLSLEDQLQLYDEVHRLYQHRGMSLECILFSILTIRLPPDAYIRCTDKLFVGRSSPLWRGCAYQEISTFSSNEHLIQCIIESTTIPGITCSTWRGMFTKMDGIVGYALWGQQTHNSKSTITTPSNSLRPQTLCGIPMLHLWPPDILYRYIFSPSDKHIELRLLQGIFDTQQYFATGDTQDLFTMTYTSDDSFKFGLFKRIRRLWSYRS